MAQLKNILLVDDDDDLREALAEQLILLDEFEVAEAANGQEATKSTQKVRIMI